MHYPKPFKISHNEEKKVMFNFVEKDVNNYKMNTFFKKNRTSFAEPSLNNPLPAAFIGLITALDKKKIRSGVRTY